MIDIEQTLMRFQRPLRLRRFPCALRFPEDLERTFDLETKAARVRELRMTISMGLIIYFATALTDRFFVPDLAGKGLVIRLFATPLLAIILVFIAKLSARRREGLMAATVVLVTTLLSAIPALSTASTAPYAFATVGLALMYANTTLPLRFGLARWTTSVGCVVGLLAISRCAHLDGGLAFGLDIQLLIIGVYSLMTNYRIERNVRLNYLLAAKEAHRLAVLSTLSITDALTGLANRRHFESVAASLFAAPANDGLPVGLLMIDVDCFKRYNDHYGHAGGDACLRAVAETLAGVLHGKDDLAVRHGGEEFVVLLPDVDRRQANAMAQWLRGAVANRKLDHANRDDGLTVVTVSIGVANCTLGDGTRLVDLLETADRALYAAKRLGRNRVEVQRHVTPGIEVRDAGDVLRSLGSNEWETPPRTVRRAR